MTGSVKIEQKAEEVKLITEYPLGEAVALYLQSCKKVLTSSVKALVVAGAALALVHVMVALSLTAVIAGATLSALSFLLSLVINHPFLTGLLVGVVILLLKLKGSSKSKSLAD